MDEKAGQSLKQRILSRLLALENSGLKRSLLEPTGLDLSSNDYLGFSRHPRVRKRFAEAVERLGAGSTGSRLLRGHRTEFQNIELRFAHFKGTESALFFGSGWAANLGILSAFPTADDLILSDERNHASLIDGMRLSKASRVIFPHCDATGLEQLLQSQPCSGQRFVVTESLFSMDGDIAPLKSYAELQQRYGFLLIVDEAHAVGLYGASGSGLIEELGCSDQVWLSMNSAGKALGSSGAFICGPTWAIDYLIQAARPFVFSTAPPPAVAEAIDEALDLLEEDPQLRLNVLALAVQLRVRLGLQPEKSLILPIHIGENNTAVEAATRLQRTGYDVRAIRPPTVPIGTARLRISIHAGLSAQQLEVFAACLQTTLQDIGI